MTYKNACRITLLNKIEKAKLITSSIGIFLAIQWLRLRLPVQGFRFDPWSGSYDPTCLMAKEPEYKQQNQHCKKLNKDFKNGPHQKKQMVTMIPLS